MSLTRVPGTVPIGLVVRESTRIPAEDRKWEIHRCGVDGRLYPVAVFRGTAARAWAAFEQALKAYPQDRIRLLTTKQGEQ